jgi:hypothetical protein
MNSWACPAKTLTGCLVDLRGETLSTKEITFTGHGIIDDMWLEIDFQNDVVTATRYVPD